MKNFKIFIYFIIGFSISALIWIILTFFLNKKPEFYIPNYKQYSFYHIDLYNLFFQNTNNLINKNIEKLNNLTLKATFINGKKSFIIVKDKTKTVFINLNDSYKGYKLIKILPYKAIFYKNEKNYKIEFNKKQKISFNKNLENIIYVDKSIFEEYKNNLNKIWQNIGIIKTNNGYLITYIKPKSIFEKIGLKKGDILLEINGRKLENDQDAWNLYKNADKFKYFEIKLKRKNQIKVINYEMD
jgi:type II secretion system protein C